MKMGVVFGFYIDRANGLFPIKSGLCVDVSKLVKDALVHIYTTEHFTEHS